MAKPGSWRAPHDVYTGGVYYRAGEPFDTEEPKGVNWEAIAPGAPARKVAAKR